MSTQAKAAPPPAWSSLGAQLKDLEEGRVTSVALVEQCERAYRAHHAELNALIIEDYAAARAAAERADLARAQGQSLGPLHGIPFSVKESFDVAGWPTTCGDPACLDNVAQEDSDVVARLRAAGAILVGKSNVPMHLRDWQSYNAIYGTTRNPHDVTRTPGGSSGGAAVAVACGMSAFDVGSDIGGSLRNPAHCCGIFSHKSTHGLVSMRGHGIRNEDPAPDINVAGPLARSARDLETVLRVLAPAGALQAGMNGRARRDPREFRIAVLPTHAHAPVSDQVSARIEVLGRELQRQGADVDWNVCPDFDVEELWHVYVLMLRASTSVYMDDAAYARAREIAATVDGEARDYATLQFVGATLDHRAWLKLSDRRRRLARAWARYFERFDVLLCPAAPTPAFPIDQAGEAWQRVLRVDGREQPMTSHLFWAGFSGLCGLPSTVAPAGGTPEGLPVGVQIVAAHGRDLDSLGLAQHLEASGHGYEPPPRLVESSFRANGPSS